MRNVKNRMKNAKNRIMWNKGRDNMDWKPENYEFSTKIDWEKS